MFDPFQNFTLEGEELEFQHGSTLTTNTGSNIVAMDYDALHDRFCIVTLQDQRQYFLRCQSGNDDLAEELYKC